MSTRVVALLVVLASALVGCRSAASDTECEERDFVLYAERARREWDGGNNQSLLEESCEEVCSDRHPSGGRLRTCSRFDVPDRASPTVGFYCEFEDARGRCEKDFF